MYWQKPTDNLLGSTVRDLVNNFIIQGIKDKSVRSVMTQFVFSIYLKLLVHSICSLIFTFLFS